MTTTGPEGVGATVSSTRGYGDTTSVVGSFVTTFLTPMVGTGSFYEETSSLTTYVVSGSLTTVVDGTTVVVQYLYHVACTEYKVDFVLENAF